ncbi:hypothetical protein MUK42_33694 [Musa troglodytarum]|uniref:Uncharacterized protein n=1 Tax=Musa troglodytarum TaxID=320322 RepID=A0A9E7GBW0_9LILI|nr:hypothetical protein MUK42_33694 [Musa troglodytarum]
MLAHSPVKKEGLPCEAHRNSKFPKLDFIGFPSQTESLRSSSPALKTHPILGLFRRRSCPRLAPREKRSAKGGFRSVVEVSEGGRG